MNRYLILLAALVTVVSCGNQNRTETSSSDDSKGSVVFSINFEQVSSANNSRSVLGDDICETFGIDTITATVTDSDINEIGSGSWPCDAHAGTLSNIPANRGLLALIVEAQVSGEQLWRGEANGIEIIPGQNIDVGPINMEYIGEVNQPPVADAGPVQTVNEGAMVILSGLNSYDVDDGIASFEWYQVDGEVEVIINPLGWLEATFLAPDVDSSGMSFNFILAVTDYNGQTSYDNCIINVTWANEPPYADAGEDQIVYEGTTVFLDASNSRDTDDGIASYLWKQVDDDGPIVSLSDGTSPKPYFTTPDVGSLGEFLTFELTVTDVGGLRDMDSCQVNVTPGPDIERPIVTIEEPQDDLVFYRYNDIDYIAFSGSAVSNNEVIKVEWINSAGGHGEADGTAQWYIEKIKLKLGTNVVTIIAIDSFKNEGSASRTIYFEVLDDD